MASHHPPAGFQFKNGTYSINCLCLSSVSLSLLLAIYRLLHCRCPRVLQFWGSCRRHPGQKIPVRLRQSSRQTVVSRTGQTQHVQVQHSSRTTAEHRTAAKVKPPPPPPPNEQIRTHCSRGCFCGRIVSGVSLKMLSCIILPSTHQQQH